MNKVSTIDQIMSLISDNMTVMVGGFLNGGTPDTVLHGVLEKNTTGLTLISNDTSIPSSMLGSLITNHQIKRAIVSYIGANPETGKQMMSGELEVELVPQGTLAERIRAGGSGLGGILTPTGIGTVVEAGKQKLEINGQEYLLELPLRADVAILKASKGDKAGNLVYLRTTRNFNPIMAFAADLVIAEVDELVEVGEIDPDDVMTPGVLVDHILYWGE